MHVMLCPDLPGTSSGLFAVLSLAAGSDSKSGPRVGAHAGVSFPPGAAASVGGGVSLFSWTLVRCNSKVFWHIFLENGKQLNKVRVLCVQGVTAPSHHLPWAGSSAGSRSVWGRFGPSCARARSGTSWQPGRGRLGSTQGTIVASALGCLGTSCGVVQGGCCQPWPTGLLPLQGVLWG